jgi:hypothetical protein
VQELAFFYIGEPQDGFYGSAEAER